MDTEGDRPRGSSWQRWLSRSQPEATDADDLEVNLEWPPGDGGPAHEPHRAAEPVEPEPEPEVEAEPPVDEVVEPDEPEDEPPVDEEEVEVDGDPFDDAIDEAFGPGPVGLDPDDEFFDDDTPLEDIGDDDDLLDDDVVATGSSHLPTMSGRLDSVQGTVHALGLRLEALVGATSVLRNSLADRVDDYATTVSRLSLTQARDLDEYRRANERAVGELRRASAATDESINRLEARIDELSTDIAELSRLVRSDRRTPPAAPPPAADATELAEIRDLVIAILDGLPSSADGSATDPSAALAETRKELAALRREVARLSRASSSAPALDIDALARRFVDALSNEYEVEIADGTAAGPAAAAGRPGRRRR